MVGVAAGQYHSLAVKSDGTVWAWGRNSAGQLGNGLTNNGASSTPTQVLTLTNQLQADAVVAASGLAASQVLATLGVLEMRRILCRMPGNRVARRSTG